MGRSAQPPEDLLDYVKRLEARIRNLERSQQAGNTAVDRGSVTVKNGAIVAKHPNGQELFRTGTGSTTLPFDPSPTDGFVTRVTRADGTKVLEAFSSEDGTEGKFQINDRQGSEILGDDWLFGKGLSRPFLTYNWYPITEFLSPPVSKNSATYDGAFVIQGNLQHPAIFVNVRVIADAATAGNIKLRDTFFGVDIWTAAVTTAFNGNLSATSNLPSGRGYGDDFSLELQVQRTAGAGNIRVGLVTAYGRSATSL